MGYNIYEAFWKDYELFFNRRQGTESLRVQIYDLQGACLPPPNLMKPSFILGRGEQTPKIGGLIW